MIVGTTGDRQAKKVRKHRAPKGALRLLRHRAGGLVFGGQKAPSAKRCIKTQKKLFRFDQDMDGQKAPSAKRCIKTLYLG